MRKDLVNNTKLGIFVLAGLFFLVLLLYMIGKNQSLFGPTFMISAPFNNVQGLVPGNNVRYAGIQVGTVNRIKILNDSLIEVRMTINADMKSYIRQNAIASIGTDGLIGNKVINITPERGLAPLVTNGSTIPARNAFDTDEMLRILSSTNNDVAILAQNLKSTVEKLNHSQGLWKVLNDETLPANISKSAENIQLATARAAAMASEMHSLVRDIKSGKGSLGSVLTDTVLVQNLNRAIESITQVGIQADDLVSSIQTIAADVGNEVNNGQGTIHALLKDSTITLKLHQSMDNIQKGTDGFNQNMEALKHSSLLRGYYKKLEKGNKKSVKQTPAP